MIFRFFCLVTIALFLIGCGETTITTPTLTTCPTLTTDLVAAAATYNDAVAAAAGTLAQCNAVQDALKAYVDFGCDVDGEYSAWSYDGGKQVCTATHP